MFAVNVQAATATTKPVTAAEAQFHVMAGEMAAGRSMPERAALEFLKALDFSPNADLAARATAYALAAQRDDLALDAAKRWLKSDASALDAREVIARLSLKSGATAEAMAQSQAVIAGHPGGEAEGYRHVALMLAQDASIATAAIELMKSLVAQKPQSSGAQRALGLIAYRYNDYPLAEKASREALRLQPGERESALILVGSLMRRGEFSEARTVFESFVQGQKNTNELRFGYARLLVENQQRAAAKEELIGILRAEPRHTDARFTLGLVLLDERFLPEAEAQFSELLGDADRQDDARYFLGRIAELRKQYAQALTWFEKVEGGSQALEAFVHRASMLAKLNRLPEARQLLANLREQYPPVAERLLVEEANLVAEAGDPAAAIVLLDRALQGDPDNSNLLYARSLLQEQVKRFDLAEADLRTVLAKSPNEARALNALGYLLTVHTNRWDEAAGLISRALALEPNDAAVLDSWGWVLHKLGRTEEAVSPLQKAHQLFPDPEVAAHLGEVYWVLGKRDQARAVWKTAQEVNPDHPVLRETVKRLSGNGS